MRQARCFASAFLSFNETADDQKKKSEMLLIRVLLITVIHHENRPRPVMVAFSAG
jgi:hypothetical protein